MSRLICTLPCENFIVSQDNKVSLISLIEALVIGIPANAPIADNATIPMRWFAVCIFERLPGDENKEFETYVDVGSVRSVAARFKFAGRQHRVIHQIMGLPLQFGSLRLRTFLGEVGQTPVNVGEYPLELQRLPETTH